ncbi:hypothetical protein GQ54DRAFT_323986 [Martensiomyces pterosporus]|nr:hypothetical protein GQ54DRAFT_323986 [Martensiomyces pterosporus]
MVGSLQIPLPKLDLAKAIDSAEAAGSSTGSESAEGSQGEPAASTKHRNERATRFLLSIRTSRAAGADQRATHAAVHGDGRHIDIDPQGILDFGHSGAAAARHGGHLSGYTSADGALEFPLRLTSAYRIAVADGKRAEVNEGDGLSEIGYSRRLAHNAPDYNDIRSVQHATQFVAMKPSSFPMVFASIKPFQGKGDDKNWHGGSTSTPADRVTKAGVSKKDQSFAHLLYPLHTLEPENEHETGGAHNAAYQPNRLDDPGLHKGLQRTVLGLTGYMGTVFEYTRAEDLRQELNDHFREAHPELYAVGLTLDQIRRLRTHMLRVTREQDLELSTAAIAWVYFEKLIWKGYVVKDNRKLVSAVCLYLALKINESREVSISRSLQAIQRRFEVSAKSILDQEFSVFAELDFSLWVPQREFMPHLARMFEAIGLYRTLSDYLGDSGFFECKQ